MRKWVWITLVLVVAIAALLYAFREPLGFMLFMHNAKPDAAFDAAAAPPAPDYSLDTSWAALPGVEDPSDVTPAGVTTTTEAEREVDAFFIHPTTYYGPTWNAALDDAESRTRTDVGTIRSQASVFNGCCRVFAPRYRQATLYAFVAGGDDEVGATTLAYEDVRRAFDEFLKRIGDRPFVLASHSQGSRYALWLLEDRIDTSPLRQRLVAAYVIGYAIPNDWFERRVKTIRPCKAATDTGCVLSWSSYAEGSTPELASLRHRYGERWEANGAKPLVCTNPLGWSTAVADAEVNIGAWLHGDGATPLAPQPNLTGARCDGGALFVTLPSGLAWEEGRLPGGNYHIYDYQLFYMNVRANAVLRAATFLESWHRQGDKPVIWRQSSAPTSAVGSPR
jgi:hypothetical protein